MDELAREYHDTYDPEIPEEILPIEPRAEETERAIRLLTL
jgi:hypothetical protein